MTIKDLKEYLSKWPENEEVRFLGIKPKDRIVWPHNQIGVIAITDSEVPVIGLELVIGILLFVVAVKLVKEAKR